MRKFAKLGLLSGVSAIALFAAVGCASAATVTILQSNAWSGSNDPAAPAGVTLLPLGTGGPNALVTTSSVVSDGVTATFSGGSNPNSGEYAGNTSGQSSSPFGSNNSTLDYFEAGGTNGVVTLTWSTAQTSLTMLWGTVDGETGRNVLLSNGMTITGSTILADCGTTACGNGFGGTLSGAYDVYLTITGLGSFTSATFSDSAASAFEFDVAIPTTTPLPAALPLFAGGLGMMGLLGRRRKRKAAAASA